MGTVVMKLGLWLSSGNPRVSCITRPINQPYNSCLPTSVGTTPTTTTTPRHIFHTGNNNFPLSVSNTVHYANPVSKHYNNYIILVTTDATLNQNVPNLFITPRRANSLDKCMFLHKLCQIIVIRVTFQLRLVILIVTTNVDQRCER